MEKFTWKARRNAGEAPNCGIPFPGFRLIGRNVLVREQSSSNFITSKIINNVVLGNLYDHECLLSPNIITEVPPNKKHLLCVIFLHDHQFTLINWLFCVFAKHVYKNM